jgi:hypothetical protein
VIKPPFVCNALCKALRIGMAALFLFLPGVSIASDESGTPDASNASIDGNAAEPAAQVRYGLLWLDIDPGDASVALDGRFQDVDVWLMSVPPGSHEITVRKDGFKTYEQRIDVDAGRSLHLNIRLDPESPGP